MQPEHSRASPKPPRSPGRRPLWLRQRGSTASVSSGSASCPLRSVRCHVTHHLVAVCSLYGGSTCLFVQTELSGNNEMLDEGGGRLAVGLVAMILLATESYATPEGLVLLKPKCGDDLIPCDKYQYCSDGSCHNCSNVCSPDVKGGFQGHNFDAGICESKCQDYIHDVVKHYVTIAEATEMQGEVRETIDGLRAMVALSLTLSLLVAVAMLAGLGFAWLKYRRVKKAAQRDKELAEKKMSTISSITGNIGNNNKVQSEVQTTGAPSCVTTTTPISTRHPSEDATLEGFAYDNPGMTPSPVLGPDSRGETHF